MVSGLSQVDRPLLAISHIVNEGQAGKLVKSPESCCLCLQVDPLFVAVVGDAAVVGKVHGEP